MATERQFLFVGGEWVKPASSKRIQVINATTEDSDHAFQIARQIESGTVRVNGYLPDLNAPFGGIKASGLGREMGPESVAAYQQLKSIYLTG
jgi:acyl-CoA reductase-like NAD-dependent aldehyde dehydrogenase